MVAPLKEISIIAKESFFSDTEKRRLDYFSLVGKKYDFYEERIIDGEEGVYFNEADGSSPLFLKNSELYVVECYDELERKEILSLKEKVYTLLDPAKVEPYM